MRLILRWFADQSSSTWKPSVKGYWYWHLYGIHERNGMFFFDSFNDWYESFCDSQKLDLQHSDVRRRVFRFDWPIAYNTNIVTGSDIWKTNTTIGPSLPRLNKYISILKPSIKLLKSPKLPVMSASNNITLFLTHHFSLMILLVPTIENGSLISTNSWVTEPNINQILKKTRI